MALYEPVHATPILAIQEGSIVVAATVLGRMTQFGRAYLHVAVWQAGSGQRDEYLAPAEFESWRRSFTRPSNES